jgi:tetratricopeptide (TPR) repeat protein
VVIGMLTVGVYTIHDEHRHLKSAVDMADMQRDLELLAAIGSSDQRSLRAVAYSRQMAGMDHYHFLDVPRAATRQQIINAGEDLKKRFDPSTFPPIVRDSVMMILRRADEAVGVLKDPVRRTEYDKLVQQRAGSEKTIQQRLTQRSIAEQNFNRAKELVIQGDYYGAIVLLKQAVQYVPDHAEAWYLLGACQERNPKWRRDAAESFQMALSIDPNNADALISLGDLYKLEGLVTRAQTCWEDALKISPENQQAKSRLQSIKRR